MDRPSGIGKPAASADALAFASGIGRPGSDSGARSLAAIGRPEARPLSSIGGVAALTNTVPADTESVAAINRMFPRLWPSDAGALLQILGRAQSAARVGTDLEKNLGKEWAEGREPSARFPKFVIHRSTL